MMKTCKVEQCWLLIGGSDKAQWWARCRRESRGHAVAVDFDPDYVLRREDRYHDVVGWLHTHPGMAAVPSERDHRTMRAWVDATGKPLVCAIRGRDGLRAYWYDPDEDDVTECAVKQIGSIVFGTILGLEVVTMEDSGEQVPA